VYGTTAFEVQYYTIRYWLSYCKIKLNVWGGYWNKNQSFFFFASLNVKLVWMTFKQIWIRNTAQKSLFLNFTLSWEIYEAFDAELHLKYPTGKENWICFFYIYLHIKLLPTGNQHVREDSHWFKLWTLHPFLLEIFIPTTAKGRPLRMVERSAEYIGAYLFHQSFHLPSAMLDSELKLLHPVTMGKCSILKPCSFICWYISVYWI
jgi:hypothetical protein